METCQRCGQEGSDRRTLWMACLYDMSELGLPFQNVFEGGRSYFTLRVCKGCRADWMHAIKDWFVSVSTHEREGEVEEGAVYVRDLGARRKIDREGNR